ncbi:MAG: amylo-alpha-1,6-glucosidase [Solirubrobacteraceae bacterium]
MLSPDGWPYASSQPIDRDDPGRFHALFGRDSLITSLQVLPERPDVARATLRALAELQGTVDDPDTDEEPGKIVHEYRPQAEKRFEDMGWPIRNGELRYYGSADGTSWFLVVLDALGDDALTDELSSAWRAAAQWLERALERGRGMVRYGPRRASGGLVQQGWRDTTDPLAAYGGGILDADGSMPEPPLADADTQAAAVAALRATVRLSGDSRWQSLADRTVERIGDAFTPETMAISNGDLRVAGAGSQIGWLLWADAVPDLQRDAYADRLCEPDVLTDFGLRTLSSEHPQFAPEAYHRGAAWPFDSWLGWGGLRACGRETEGERVRQGVLAALETLGDAPELYAVADDGPRRIPIANRVQAWTIGAQVALQRSWDARPPAATR